MRLIREDDAGVYILYDGRKWRPTKEIPGWPNAKTNNPGLTAGDKAKVSFVMAGCGGLAAKIHHEGEVYYWLSEYQIQLYN